MVPPNSDSVVLVPLRDKGVVVCSISISDSWVHPVDGAQIGVTPEAHVMLLSFPLSLGEHVASGVVPPFTLLSLDENLNEEVLF